MNFEQVGTMQFTLLIIGTAISFIVPVVIAIIWKVKKKERFTTILVGAATFLLFAIILEKPLQNLLILPDHAVSGFLNSRPVLWALVVALFPGVFEETGRFVAFKTVLKNRKNRETSIAYGIGHGGFEVIFILGLTYITYIGYAVMINSGTFISVVNQVLSQAPDQAEQVYALVSTITSFSVSDLALGLFERVFAVMFHIGASIIVFYACKEKKKIWLYPLAILLHTVLDLIAALNMRKVIELSDRALESIVCVFGLLTFFGAYFLLYRKDKEKDI